MVCKNRSLKERQRRGLVGEIAKCKLQIIIRTGTSNAIYTPPDGAFLGCDRADHRAIKAEEVFKRGPRGSGQNPSGLQRFQVTDCKDFQLHFHLHLRVLHSSAKSECNVLTSRHLQLQPCLVLDPYSCPKLNPNPSSNGFCLVHCAFDWLGP